jgi:hypothetical protein
VTPLSEYKLHPPYPSSSPLFDGLVDKAKHLFKKTLCGNLTHPWRTQYTNVKMEEKCDKHQIESHVLEHMDITYTKYDPDQC